MKQSSNHDIKVYMPPASSSNMLSIAFNMASVKGIPVSLLNREYVVINNYGDASEASVKLSDLSPRSDLYVYSIASRFSLPDALLKKYIYLTSKMYTSKIEEELLADYIYYVVAALYSSDVKYEFLEDELLKIEKEVFDTGTFKNSNKDFKSSSYFSGTFSEHMIACNYMLGINKHFKINDSESNMVPIDRLMEVISIINHLPIVSQFSARSRSIVEPSMQYSEDWNRFIMAGENLLSLVYNIFKAVGFDYWKAYHFFVNNDVREIANITSFSEIDEEAVDNWVEIPKSLIKRDINNYVTIDNLNYLKWDNYSRY
jgi:hypothetical protein